MLGWAGLVFGIILLIIASWVGIHLLAIFGIFVALAYPFCWLLVPNRIPCLLCRAQRDGTKCPFCRNQIKKSEGVFPRHLTSAILNAFLIIVFSLVSIGIVFVESRVLYYFGFLQAQKTASFDIPSKGSYLLGETFPMQIDVNNIKNAINAVQADVSFDPSRLEVMQVSTKGSFANIFVQKEINNQQGYVRMSGGLPNPGWYGAHGLFGTIYFKALEPGIATVSYLPTSMVLANDGRGSDILQNHPSVSYLILPQKISEELGNQQQKLLSYNEEKLNDSNQLDFSNQTNVLGTSTQNIKDANSGRTAGFNILHFLLEILFQIDSFILGFVSKITSLVGL